MSNKEKDGTKAKNSIDYVKDAEIRKQKSSHSRDHSRGLLLNKTNRFHFPVCLFSYMDYRGRQNAVRTTVTNLPEARWPLFLFLPYVDVMNDTVESICLIDNRIGLGNIMLRDNDLRKV